MRPRSRIRHAGFLTLLVLALTQVQCGGGEKVEVTGQPGEVSGLVIKGPVKDARVAAYRLSDTLERGSLLAEARTGDDGRFSLQLPAHNGPLLLVASSGRYQEEATGTEIGLGTSELATVYADYKAGVALTGVNITPVSTLAVALAGYHVKHRGAPYTEAIDKAFQYLNEHFGNIDWRVVVPADPTHEALAGLTPQARAGLVLAGLSFEARQMSDASGVTRGVINATTLTAALADDLATDGTFDGIGQTGPLRLEKAALDGNTVRKALAQAIHAFLTSDRNATKLTVADVKTVLTDPIAANNVAFLFCPGQSTTCGAEKQDIDAPVVTFVKPSQAGAGVRGLTELQVQAVDSSGLKSLAFAAPSGGTFNLVREGTTTAILTGTVDFGLFQDGPTTLVVRAEDNAGNPVEAALEVRVANHGPLISVARPTQPVVSGSAVVIEATAVQTTGAIKSFKLLEPLPAGFRSGEVDEDTTVGRFLATWDTTRVTEGPHTLTFEAVDEYDTVTRRELTLTVDNVPLGIVTVALSAGAPIQGASVKLYAIDPGSGLPAKARYPPDGLLGQTPAGTVTDGGGLATFTLAQENWSGPVQLVASGDNLSFIDPTDGVTRISVDPSFRFTSYLSSFTTGSVPPAFPITLWTTLADATALSLAQGLNPGNGNRTTTIAEALSLIDERFSRHVRKDVSWSLRSVLPLDLTKGPEQSIGPRIYAALPDVALNQLARDLALARGQQPGQIISAMTLAAELLKDVKSGDRFDGKQLGAALSLPGNPGYVLSPSTTRRELALALDHYVEGANEKVGLSRATLTDALVYDSLSTDVSALLYRPEDLPEPFDNMGPAARLSATFKDSTGAWRPPVQVGAAQLVRRELTLVPTAEDPSGVARVELWQGSTKLTAQPQVPGDPAPPTYLVTASQDGALILTVKAVDGLGNPSSTDFTYEVDGTPPSIAVASDKPVAGGYYANAVEVRAVADDLHGVAPSNYTHSGLPGFTPSLAAQVDGLVMSGTWNSTSVAEGAYALRLKAVDPVSNTTELTRTIYIDHTAPTVTLVGQAARYIRSNPWSFSVAVSDGTGSGARTLTVDYGDKTQPETVNLGDRTQWTFSHDFAFAGTFNVTVWATDAVGNSGQGNVAKSAALTVTYDPNPDKAQYQDAPSYVSERDMGIASMSPARYSFPGGAVKVSAAGSGVKVQKASTRLSWGDREPTYSELVNQDPSVLNVPFVKFSVPHVQGESPLKGVMFTVRCSGNCGSFTSAPARPPIKGSGQDYLVPLSLELVPGLGQIGDDAQLQVSVTTEDMAGNVIVSDPVYVTFAVVAPPLQWDEDALYSGRGDTKSTYGYTLRNSNYHRLFDRSFAAFGPDQQVRLVRYLVKNPAPVPVALSVALSGGLYEAVEHWQESWSEVGYRGLVGDAYCQPTLGGTYYCVGSACYPTTTPDHPNQVRVTSVLDVQAYLAQATAGESTVAARAADGSFLVPAASSSAPGELAIYVQRPVVARTSDAYVNWFDNFPVGSEEFACGNEQVCVWDDYEQREKCSWVPHYGQHVYDYNHAEQNLGAGTRLSGGLTATSRGLQSGSGNVPYGETRSVAATNLGREIAQ